MSEVDPEEMEKMGNAIVYLAEVIERECDSRAISTEQDMRLALAHKIFEQARQTAGYLAASFCWGAESVQDVDDIDDPWV